MPQIKQFLPNAITLMGALSAVLSMLWAREHPYWACNALIAAALFDMIDGRVARLLDAQSEIGQQLDSLVDVIAFGVAPAYLAYAFRLYRLDSIANVPLGVIPLFAFIACSALRLAMFNTRIGQGDESFSGIPTPVAALLVVTSIMTWHEVGVSPFGERWFLTSVLVIAAALMVLPLPFQSFKHFKSRVAQMSYFGAMAGGVTMLLLRLPGGTVLFGFVSMYVLRGLVGAALSTRST